MLYLIHFYEYLWDWCVNFRECKAPRFIRKPRSTEVVEGDSLVIVCEVAGDPKPDVIWLRDWLNVSFKLNTFFMLTSYSTAALPANSNCFSKISFNYWVQWLVKGSKKKLHLQSWIVYYFENEGVWLIWKIVVQWLKFEVCKAWKIDLLRVLYRNRWQNVKYIAL